MNRFVLGIAGAVFVAGTALAQEGVGGISAPLNGEISALAAGCCADRQAFAAYLNGVANLPWQHEPASAAERYGSDNSYSRYIIDRFLARDYRDTAGHFHNITQGLTAEQREAQHQLFRNAVGALSAGQAVDGLVAEFKSQLELIAADQPSPDFGRRLELYLQHARNASDAERAGWLASLFEQDELVRVTSLERAFGRDAGAQ